MNNTQGCNFFANANKRLTSCVPWPAYREAWKSLPDADRKGKPTSPAKARAQCVLPTPGGPSSKTPLGGTAPSFSYFSRLSSMSTRSRSSSMASSCPRTSPKPTSTHEVTWKTPSGRAFAFLVLASCKLSSTSSSPIASRSALTALMAASFNKPCKSAGEKEGVLRASTAKSGPSPAKLSFSAAPKSNSLRQSVSGNLNSIRRSKRPARSSASSRTSGRLVAARNKTPDEGWKPSIFARRALRLASWSRVTEPPISPAS
mmetsp:Transcript_69230/g.179934  ORF Transcript_69230/g.179934 Transcript_69230/m.179934 type:complete len:259 (-) Transcript_69230:73-849(-)